PPFTIHSSTSSHWQFLANSLLTAITRHSHFTAHINCIHCLCHHCLYCLYLRSSPLMSSLSSQLVPSLTSLLMSSLSSQLIPSLTSLLMSSLSSQLIPSLTSLLMSSLSSQLISTLPISYQLCSYLVHFLKSRIAGISSLTARCQSSRSLPAADLLTQ